MKYNYCKLNDLGVVVILKKYFDSEVKYYNYMKKIIHYLIIGLLACMMLFLIASIFHPELLTPVIEWIKTSIEKLGKWNYLLAFMAALAESLPIIGSIFPWQVIMLSVGWFYWWQWPTEFFWVMCAAILGSVLSNAVGYFLGKYYGESFFSRYGLWVGIEETELKYLKRWVDTWWAWWIILSKFHAQLRAFLPFIAGSMWFSTGRFWFFNLLASTLWSITFITIGIFFAEHYETILKYLWWIFTGIFIVVFGYFFLFQREKLKKYMREKNAEMERKYKKKHS